MTDEHDDEHDEDEDDPIGDAINESLSHGTVAKAWEFYERLMRDREYEELSRLQSLFYAGCGAMLALMGRIHFNETLTPEGRLAAIKKLEAELHGFADMAMVDGVLEMHAISKGKP